MKKFNFPSEYKSEHSLYDLAKFISLFKFQLIPLLEKNFNILYLEVPKIEFLKTTKNSRAINFDNKNNNQIYQFCFFPCQYLSDKLEHLENDNLSGALTLYTQYNRDAQINNLNYITKNVIDIRIKCLPLEHQTFLEIFKEKYDILMKSIKEVIEIIKNNFVNFHYNGTFLEKQYKEINFRIFNSNLQTLKLDQFIEEQVFNDKYICLHKVNQFNSIYLNSFSQLDDKNENAQLIYFLEKYEQIINWASVAFSKIGNIQYLHISIDVDHLIMILLNKIHISEVSPCTWDNDFYVEIANKKMKVF